MGSGTSIRSTPVRAVVSGLARAHRFRAIGYLSLDDTGPFRAAWRKELSWRRTQRTR
jgi:hypothetical protein